MLLALRHFPAGTEGQTYWYHLDGRGSVAGLTKHQGQSTHNYRYDAYGQLLPAQGNFTDPHNPYTFAGKEWDEALGLYEFGVRLYDPWAGVWLTREPMPAQAWQPRTWHRYQYAFANPISYYDPYGLWVPVEDGEAKPSPPIPPLITFRNLPVDVLVERYQQDQGPTNYCASYAIATAINLLYGTEKDITGMDVVNAIRAHQFLPWWSLKFPPQVQPIIWWSLLGDDRVKPWPYYSLLPDGGAVTPIQQVHIVNRLMPQLLWEQGLGSGIRAEARALSAREMVSILRDPYRVALFTYNVDLGNPFSGHVIVLVAYDPQHQRFGFLNSGAEQNFRIENGERRPDLTWKSEVEIEQYLRDPGALFIRPNFVIIERVVEGDVIFIPAG